MHSQAVFVYPSAVSLYMCIHTGEKLVCRESRKINLFPSRLGNKNVEVMCHFVDSLSAFRLYLFVYRSGVNVDRDVSITRTVICVLSRLRCIYIILYRQLQSQIQYNILAFLLTKREMPRLSVPKYFDKIANESVNNVITDSDRVYEAFHVNPPSAKFLARV